MKDNYLAKKQQKYIDRIEKVVVKYSDGSKKTFTGADWFIHEVDISRLDVEIRIFYKESKFPFLLSEFLTVVFGVCLFINIPDNESVLEVIYDRKILLCLVIVLAAWSIFLRNSEYEKKHG